MATGEHREEYRFNSFVRGYAYYRCFWPDPYVNEVLPATPESDNPYDSFAVAIVREKNVVGHVPREISKIVSQFLNEDGTTVSCRVAGLPVDRRIKKGVEVPCVYEFRGRSSSVKKIGGKYYQ